MSRVTRIRAEGSKVLLAASLLGGALLFASPAVSASTPAVAPDAPTGFNITDRYQAVHLHWNPPSYDGGSPVTHYKIYGDHVLLVDLVASATCVHVSGDACRHVFVPGNRFPSLSLHTPVSFTVTAVNAVGDSVGTAEIKGIPLDDRLDWRYRSNLYSGERLSSQNHLFHLVMQADGNLVERRVADHSVVFQTGIPNATNVWLRIFGRGYLELKGRVPGNPNYVVWAPRLYKAGGMLVLADSGHLLFCDSYERHCERP